MLYCSSKTAANIFLYIWHSPIAIDGDNEGIVFKTVEDSDTISSLGGHNTTQLLSVIKACPSLH